MKEFDVIYDAYFRDVYRFVLSLAKDEEVAEDVVQDTFIKALNGIGGLKDEAKVKPWLFQIAKNTYLTHVSKSVKTVSLDELEVASLQNTEADFLQQETAKRARHILHKMKEPYKEAFYLRVFVGLSFREIAEIFGKEEAWARQVFHRAKLMIKEKL